MSLLESRVRTEGKTGTGKIIVPFGVSKLGKTTTFTQAPNTILVEVKDKSADVLKESGQMDKSVPVIQTNDWPDSLAVLRELAETQHGYRVAVIDGGSGLSEFCDEYIIGRSFAGDQKEFASWGRGDRLASFEWGNLLNLLDRMKERGMTVFMICHQGTSTVKNPLGDDYLKAVPHMSKEKLAMTTKYSDAILFMTSVVAQRDVNDKTGVGKAVGGEKRIMHTKPSAAYEAGNRMGLDDPIDLGDSHQEAWANFVIAVKQAKAAKSKEQQA